MLILACEGRTARQDLSIKMQIQSLIFFYCTDHGPRGIRGFQVGRRYHFKSILFNDCFELTIYTLQKILHMGCVEATLSSTLFFLILIRDYLECLFVPGFWSGDLLQLICTEAHMVVQLLD